MSSVDVTAGRSNPSLTMDAASRESRWFWIPSLFGGFLFVCAVLRWLPAAMIKAHDPVGVVQVIDGDLVLAWKSFLRCVVAYCVTAFALDSLPPIRWRQAVGISVLAVLAEIGAEFVRW
jgi:hypothetical protein